MIGKVITGAQRIGRGTDIDVPFAQKGELGYDPAVTKLIRKYSNVISPKNFRELLESVYPENLGKIGQYTGPQISGGTVIQPFTDTSGLGSNKWKWILRGLSTLGLPASTSYIRRNKGK